ncbi:hypothetical protein RGRSB_0430 [cyanobacterium endosymbiont of Rhopalodia gibberula]|uniref:DUF948 domain-containing protein n=1 Tax=cyanobacterium endosymbiont of Rhopalodia gibberula TaxID=1763363 RepID=UPI000DC724CF|nr:DUF948 domain-containing protein [cyanobacterium endosymbiont of Rhopalodia gibberula]BBA79012.1 hypothetical protein RGRSB_0430 [cyanobacterium endosymbiont of Rhopalodia gibberula]
MSYPLLWLGLSLLLVTVSLTAVLIVAIPTCTELVRAARSVEKLCDTLNRELPPTLESIRRTGLEITELTDELNNGVKSASDVVKRLELTLSKTQRQVSLVQQGTRRVAIGFKAAWQKWQSYPTQKDWSPKA